MKKDFIVDKLSRVLECIKEQLKDIEEYHETNYFTILGELRAIEKMIKFLDIDDIAIEIKFNSLWELNKKNQGI
jgi:chemotaxis signal transduction protein